MTKHKNKDRNEDVFLQILKKQLLKIDPEKQTVNELLTESVAEYMAHLMSIGNIPNQLLDSLEEDLREEALEIYRKITYGSLNLKDFLDKQKSKTTRKLSS